MVNAKPAHEQQILHRVNASCQELWSQMLQRCMIVSFGVLVMKAVSIW